MAEKRPAQKGYFLVPKKCILRNFLLQLFEYVILWADAFGFRWFACIVFAQEFV